MNVNKVALDLNAHLERRQCWSQISPPNLPRDKTAKGRSTVILQPVIEGFRTLIHSSMSPVPIHQCHHGLNLESIVRFTHHFED